jgi:hypothetical protein
MCCDFQNQHKAIRTQINVIRFVYHVGIPSTT